MKTILEANNFEGHLIKYAKGHYCERAQEPVQTVEDIKEMLGAWSMMASERVSDASVWFWCVKATQYCSPHEQQSIWVNLFNDTKFGLRFTNRAEFPVTVDLILGALEVIQVKQGDEVLVVLPELNEDMKNAIGAGRQKKVITI